MISYEHEYNDEPNPRAKANCLSVLFFWWTIKIFKKGWKMEFQEYDLYKPLKEHSCKYLGDKFTTEWDAACGVLARYNLSRPQRAPTTKSRNPKFWVTMTKIFGPRMFLYGFIYFSVEVIRLHQPLLLGLLLKYFSEDNKLNKNAATHTYLNRLIYYNSPNQSAVTIAEAYVFGTCVVLCSALAVFVTHPVLMGLMHEGMKMRVTACSAIYRKTLRLSKASMNRTSAGNIVNLMSNDVSRFDTAAIFFHHLWTAPLLTMIATYLMYSDVGMSAIYGSIVIMMFVPFQIFLGVMIARLRMKTAICTDERVRIMNEVVQSIDVIKMYTWEGSFQDLVAQARRREIREITWASYIRGVVMSFIMFTTRIAVFVTIVTYVQGDEGDLTVEKVFIVTAFYNIIKTAMTVFFVQGITQVAELVVALERIQEYLDYSETTDPTKDCTRKEEKRVTIPDIPEEFQNYRSISQVPDDISMSRAFGSMSTPVGILRDRFFSEEDLSPRIYLDKVYAKWREEDPKFNINNITIDLEAGTLCAVTGPVGSGKSSLLYVFLKELPVCSGHARINGAISYASQEPWLFVGSVRQNIIFGLEYNRRRYRMVLAACALDRDFELLPNGDHTVVGERGVSLSGGQRARVNLARAVYRNADIYLLDDPLSAVDTKVGVALFQNCIGEFLKDKTVILVTHQLQYLKFVEHVILMDDGRIQVQGTFEEVLYSGSAFANMLKEVKQTGDMVEEDRVMTETTEEAEPVILKKGNTQFAALMTTLHDSMSLMSLSTKVKPNLKADAEKVSSGRVKGVIYKKYFRAGGSCPMLILMCFLFLAAQAMISVNDYWVSVWVAEEEAYIVTGGERWLPLEMSIIIYGAITCAIVFVSLLRSYVYFRVCMQASINLHDNMFLSISRASMRFFTTNPSGRILNRFSKDMGNVDENLPQAMLDSIQIILNMVGVLCVVSVVNPYLILPLTLVLLSFYLIRRVYIKTSVTIKRLEGATSSPLFLHVNQSLRGLPSIRSSEIEGRLYYEYDIHQDLHSSTWFLFIATSRAFGYWLDIGCVIFMAIVTYAFILMDNFGVAGNGADVGLAITQCISLTGMFQWGMRQSAEVENQMTSVERVVEYEDIEHEPALYSEPGMEPPPEWPTTGEVEFRDVTLRYAVVLPPVLHNLSFVAESMDKVGIVGRTGAGKSTIIAALFRMALIEGEILIDGRDTGSMGLHELRRHLSIIPQDPVLFSTTLRKNLDPFGEYSDDNLFTALHEVELMDIARPEIGGLQYMLQEGGLNLSIGQRQLVCLARALVRSATILVLDEATANVDVKTDRLIQNAISLHFSHCTVFTIAHRLHTVMTCDKIVVIDAGRILEYDRPWLLLQKPDSILRSLVRQTGHDMAAILTAMAKKTYMESRPTSDSRRHSIASLWSQAPTGGSRRSSTRSATGTEHPRLPNIEIRKPSMDSRGPDTDPRPPAPSPRPRDVEFRSRDQESRLQDPESRLRDHEPRPRDSVSRPQGPDTRPPGPDPTPPGSDSIPSNQESRQRDPESKSRDTDLSRSREPESSPRDQEFRQQNLESRPRYSESRPRDQEPRLQDPESRLRDHEPRRRDSVSRPQGPDTRPPGRDRTPPGSDSLPPNQESRPRAPESRSRDTDESRSREPESSSRDPEFKSQNRESRPRYSESRPQDQEPRLQEPESRLRDHERRRRDSESRPQGSDTRPPGPDPTPPGSDSIPSNQESRQRPPESKSRDTDESRSREPESSARDPESRLRDQESRLQEPESRLRDHERRRRDSESRPQGSDTIPPGPDPTPPGSDSIPPNQESRQRPTESKSRDQESRLQEPESRLRDHERRRRDSESKPQGSDTRPPGPDPTPPGSDSIPPNQESRQRPTESKSRDTDESRSREPESSPRDPESRPRDQESRLQEPESRLRDHERRRRDSESRPQGSDTRPPGPDPTPPGSDSIPPNQESRQRPTESKSRDTDESRSREPEYSPRDPKFKSQNPESRPQDQEPRLQEPESRLRDHERRRRDSESRPQGSDTRSPGPDPTQPGSDSIPSNQESRQRAPESKSRDTDESRSREPESSPRDPEFRPQNLESRPRGKKSRRRDPKSKLKDHEPRSSDSESSSDDTRPPGSDSIPPNQESRPRVPKPRPRGPASKRRESDSSSPAPK